MNNLSKDIKFHILSFLTNRKKFDQIDNELEETIESLNEDRGYFFDIRKMKTINELEFLITVVKVMNIK